jgi:hypothetical protein
LGDETPVVRRVGAHQVEHVAQSLRRAGDVVELAGTGADVMQLDV